MVSFSGIKPIIICLRGGRDSDELNQEEFLNNSSKFKKPDADSGNASAQECEGYIV